MIKAGAPENILEDYPEIQIEAASHYTFAMRELLKRWGFRLIYMKKSAGIYAFAWISKPVMRYIQIIRHTGI